MHNSRDSPETLGEDHVKCVVPLQSMEDHFGADIHTAAHGGPQAAAGGVALKKDAAHGDPMLEMASSRNCSQWRTHVGEVCS